MEAPLDYFSEGETNAKSGKNKTRWRFIDYARCL